MRITYPEVIRESVNELQDLEESLRGQASCDRVRMLRLLKSGKYRSMRSVAPLLGYSTRQLRRWWQQYQEDGLKSLLAHPSPGGRRSRVSDEVWDDVARAIREGRLLLATDVQNYLLSQHGVVYESLQGVLDLLKRRGVDLKAQRQHHGT